METIIGLGAAGCNIAEKFSKFPQYDVYKIDVGITGDNCFSFPLCLSPEEYERKTPDLSAFVKNIEGEILFIVGGGGKISGASLQILKQLSNCRINILYVLPDPRTLSKVGVLQNKVAFNVLQEYARSGILERMFIVNNEDLEKMIGEVTILEYNDKINSLIAESFHYINFFNHSKPILENVEPLKEVQKISTIGILDIENNIETLFFPLQFTAHKCYYYAIPENVLKTDSKLFNKVKNKVAEENSSYQLFSTTYEKSFAYFISHTNYIQTLDRPS